MEELLSIATVPAIVAIVYWVINLIKYTSKNNEKLTHFFPLIACGLGSIIGIIAFFVVPEIMPTENIYTAIVMGGASGLTATGFNQIIKQLKK